LGKFQTAGRELIKLIFGNAARALASKANPTGYSPLINNPVYNSYMANNVLPYIMGSGSSSNWQFNWSTSGNNGSLILIAEACPVVSAVFSRQSSAFISGRQMVMKGDKEVESNAASKGVRALLRQPNKHETGMQFFARSKFYQRTYGICYILKIKPLGYEDDYSKWNLWLIPNWMIEHEYSQADKIFFTDEKPLGKIWMKTSRGKRIELNQDNLIIIKENGVGGICGAAFSGYQSESIFLPRPAMIGLQNPIDTFICSIYSRQSLVKERGPLWLLTNDNPDKPESGAFPLDQQDKDDLQNAFSGYGLLPGQKKAIVSDAHLKLQSVGFYANQLKLLEGAGHDVAMICTGLEIPTILLGFKDATFENQRVAERSLYSNWVIPDAESFYQQLSSGLELEKVGLSIQIDYTNTPALQANKKESAEARSLLGRELRAEFFANMITYNRMMVLLNEDDVSWGDRYFYQMTEIDFTPPKSGGVQLVQQDSGA